MLPAGNDRSFHVRTDRPATALWHHAACRRTGIEQTALRVPERLTHGYGWAALALHELGEAVGKNSGMSSCRSTGASGPTNRRANVAALGLAQVPEPKRECNPEGSKSETTTMPSRVAMCRPHC